VLTHASCVFDIAGFDENSENLTHIIISLSSTYPSHLLYYLAISRNLFHNDIVESPVCVEYLHSLSNVPSLYGSGQTVTFLCTPLSWLSLLWKL